MQHDIGHKLNKRPRPAGDLERQLVKILKFISRSCEHFDEGDEDEALRLATELRKLLYDGPTSHSVLKQIGIKDTLHFVDTGVYPRYLDIALQEMADANDGQSIAMPSSPGLCGLVNIEYDNNGFPFFAAPLGESLFHHDDPRRKAYGRANRFDEWWNTELIKASSGRLFSRRNLIMVMANQDNGAHVDPEVDGDFQDLCIDTLGIQSKVGMGDNQAAEFLNGGGELPYVAKSLPYASVRQIAFEVQTTIERYLTPPEPGQMVLAMPFPRKLVGRPILGPLMVMGRPDDLSVLDKHRAAVFAYKPVDWESR